MVISLQTFDAHIAEWYLWNRTGPEYLQVGRYIVVEEQK